MNEKIAPHGCLGEYKFAARGRHPALLLKWYAGGLRPVVPDSLVEGKPLIPRGVLFVGDKGAILGGGAGGNPTLLPESKLKGYTWPKPTLARPKGHHRELARRLQGRRTRQRQLRARRATDRARPAGNAGTTAGTSRRLGCGADGVRGISEEEPIIREPYRAGWDCGE